MKKVVSPSSTYTIQRGGEHVLTVGMFPFSKTKLGGHPQHDRSKAAMTSEWPRAGFLTGGRESLRWTAVQHFERTYLVRICDHWRFVLCFFSMNIAVGHCALFAGVKGLRMELKFKESKVILAQAWG